MQRPTGEIGKANHRPSTGELFAGLQALIEWMCDTTYDDGGERKTSTLTVFSDAGQWKVIVNDRETGNVAFFTGNTVEECLLSANDALRSQTACWRRSLYAKGNSRKSS